jgi:hypothetical protein
MDSKICEDTYYSQAYRTNISNVFESGVALEDTSGVVIMLEDGNCIGTKWGNKEIGVEELKQDKFKKELIMNLNQFNESEIIHNDIGRYSKDDDILKESMSTRDNESANDEKELTRLEGSKLIDENQDNSEYIETKTNIEEMDIKIPLVSPIGNQKSDMKEKNVITLTGQAKKIFANFPGMYPFEDDEIRECVKLEPNDIGIFSMDKWPLATNSFLLHGYYTYRHLIFARMRKENTFKYILGVPGIFRDRERFMASMFGFKNFKGVRNKPLSNGEFGYWYLEIRL